MASRLYRTTQPLYLEVIRQLRRLGIGAVGSPTTFAWIALYASGVTQDRLSKWPNRLLSEGRWIL